MQTNVIFYITMDNEQMALDEIELIIKNAGLSISQKPQVINKTRACRNAFGSKIPENSFDEVDQTSDGGWFDDYDYEVAATIIGDDVEFIQKQLEKASCSFTIA